MKKWKKRLQTALLYLLLALLALLSAVGIWSLKARQEERTIDREMMIAQEYAPLESERDNALSEYRLESRMSRSAHPAHTHRKPGFPAGNEV